MSIPELTKTQFDEAIRQVVACGDFRKLVSTDDRQAVVYLPGYGMADLQARYDELLYAVQDKHPGETRHQTALRLIKEHENARSQGSPSKAS